MAFDRNRRLRRASDSRPFKPFWAKTYNTARVPPVLATTPVFVGAKAEALKHGSFLLEGVVVALASAESISKVLVILVSDVRLFRMNTTLDICRGIDAKVTRARYGISSGSAVAGKISFAKYFHKSMLTVTLYGAGIADTRRRSVRLTRIRRRRVACEAGEDTLAKGPESFSAVLDTLHIVLAK